VTCLSVFFAATFATTAKKRPAGACATDNYLRVKMLPGRIQPGLLSLGANPPEKKKLTQFSSNLVRPVLAPKQMAGATRMPSSNPQDMPLELCRADRLTGRSSTVLQAPLS